MKNVIYHSLLGLLCSNVILAEPTARQSEQVGNSAPRHLFVLLGRIRRSRPIPYYGFILNCVD